MMKGHTEENWDTLAKSQHQLPDMWREPFGLSSLAKLLAAIGVSPADPVEELPNQPIELWKILNHCFKPLSLGGGVLCS